MVFLILKYKDYQIKLCSENIANAGVKIYFQNLISSGMNLMAYICFYPIYYNLTHCNIFIIAVNLLDVILI
jgi:hypothetical protein